MRASTAFLTDQYELTMLQAALQSGVAAHRAVFEVFARRLPGERRYGVLAGTGRLLEAIEAFRFDDRQLAWLAERFDPPTCEWLAGYRFAGDVVGFAEGELYFPDEPVLTVEATFGEALLLETLVLSVLNHDSAVATAAARMAVAAGDRPLIEMGGRRTHEQAAVACARAAYLAGFSSTSNLEAGKLYGIPTAGTSAHAFTLAHPSEEDAFRAQLCALGVDTTLLVDTYDVERGVRVAVDQARAVGASGPGAVRIDSGDLAEESRRVRAVLDGCGATATRIVVSGDLDEYGIAALQRAQVPIDAYGVGTRVATGSGAPTAEMVYKLVAVADRPGPGAPLRPVAKRSHAKATVGGRKAVWRQLDGSGRAVADVIVIEGQPPDGPVRPLQLSLISGGTIRGRPDLAAVRAHHEAARGELPPAALALDPGPPAIEVRGLRQESAAP